MMNNIHIIAEAGTNHNGDLDTAKKLIDVAVTSRADSVKFQIIYPDGLYLPFFLENGQYIENPVFKQRTESMLTDDDYRKLALYCRTSGIKFSASVFDQRGVDLLNDLDVEYIKIASVDLNNSHLLIAAAETGKKVIVSTGMATLGEIDRAVSDVISTGFTNLVLMHCVSVYPCATQRMNIRFVDILKRAFGFPVGFSDHTEGSIASALAIGFGATWIEKHFTLDRTQKGFDHAYAFEPDRFKLFVDEIRTASEACELSKQKIQPEELITKKRARRGLYAARDLKPGEILTPSDVLVVRPENSLSPNDLSLIVGKAARQGIQKYEPLSLNQF